MFNHLIIALIVLAGLTNSPLALAKGTGRVGSGGLGGTAEIRAGQLVTTVDAVTTYDCGLLTGFLMAIEVAAEVSDTNPSDPRQIEEVWNASYIGSGMKLFWRAEKVKSMLHSRNLAKSFAQFSLEFQQATYPMKVDQNLLLHEQARHRQYLQNIRSLVSLACEPGV